MAGYIISSKKLPKLTKRKTVIKLIGQAGLKRQTVGHTPAQQHIIRPNIISNKKTNKIQLAVAHQKHLKRSRSSKTKKNPAVKYVTRDISPESLRKIKYICNCGLGKLLVIVANGPSLLEADLGLLKGNDKIDILSVNKPDKRVWPTTYWSFFDKSQYRRHEDLWHNYNGTIFNSTGIPNQKETSMQFKNIGGKGFSLDMTKGLHIGRSTTYASMQIGLWMGYNHIYIFGVDMNADGKNGLYHYYGINPDVKPDVRKKRFAQEAEHYSHAASELSAEIKKRFTFCSADNPWDFIHKFNSMDHKIAVNVILDHAKLLNQ